MAFKNFGRWLGDSVIAQQRFAQRCRFALRSRHLFIARRAKRMNDFIDQLGIVRRIHAN